jgi:hypothetical protein
MPSYIELDKQGSFPPSSNIGKLIFGVNTSGDATLTNVNGVTSVIGGGGGTGIQIPQPIVLFTGVTGQYIKNGLSIQLPDTEFISSSINPELFLFRWKRGKYSTRSNSVDPRGKRKKNSKWVHPTTEGSETKWAGWKFFNGKQWHNPTNTELTGRTTEWEIPLTINPYEIFGIDFNKYMFWNFRSSGILQSWDENIFSSGVFSPTIHQVSADKIKIGMQKPVSNIIKYSLAVAIDNPEATKTNGLCPKIFGPLSEPFYTVVFKDINAGGFIDINIVRDNHMNHKHVYKNAIN